VFYEVDRDALALLRTAKAHHDRLEPRKPVSEGSRVALGLVAEHAGLKPETLRYERTVREGALAWAERLGGVPGLDIYRVTRRGLEMLRAS
jgi:hypothetical protein